MTDLLIYGDTERSPDLRHEIPLGIGDPFLYLETDGRRAAVVSVLERERVAAAVPDIEQITPEELGMDELIAAGRTLHEIQLEVSARAARKLGLRSAIVPPDFPLSLADRMRADGTQLTADADAFEERRRVKTEAELAGVRRAQRAAEAGFAAAAALLRESSARDGVLYRDGEPLTSEAVRDAIRHACAQHGAIAPPDTIVAGGAQGAAGHESGHGPLPADAPIIIDLWPQDQASRCWADMTRTFVVGTPPDEVVEMHRLALEAQRKVQAQARAGMLAVDLYGVACDVFEAAGHATQRTKTPGQPLDHGFFHSLGHGVGLEVHEAPVLGRAGQQPLVAGDVVASEPGTYRPGFGGVRLEDLLLITADGAELFTDYSYDLAP